MRKRSWLLGATSLSLVLWLSACTTPLPPPPCACQQLLDNFNAQALAYHDALKDKGLLRQAVKACNERGTP